MCDCLDCRNGEPTALRLHAPGPPCGCFQCQSGVLGDAECSECVRSPAPTSLDAPKQPDIPDPPFAALPPDPLAVQSRWQRALHRRVEPVRRAVVDAFADSGSDRLAKRAGKLASCGACPFASVAMSGAVRFHPSLCRDRMCPTCQRYRALKLKERVTGLLRQVDSVRFLTLTLAHVDAPLADQLDKLRECWRRLRRTRFWTDRVQGGVYGVEVKLSQRDGLWHVHLHALVTGDFIPQDALSAIWHEITGDSFICDIKAVHDRKDVASYIAAYVTKGSKVEQWPSESIAEFALAMHGVRLLQTFGTLHGVKLETETIDDDKFGHAVGIDLVSLEHHALAGNFSAMLGVEALRQLDAEFVGLHLGHVDTGPAAEWIKQHGAAAAIWSIRTIDGWHWPPPEIRMHIKAGERVDGEGNRAARVAFERAKQRHFEDQSGAWSARAVM